MKMKTREALNNSGILCPTLMGINYLAAPHSYGFYQLPSDLSIELAIQDLLLVGHSQLPDKEEVDDVELQFIGNLTRRRGIRMGRETWFTYYTMDSDLEKDPTEKKVYPVRFTVVPDLDSDHEYINGRCLIEFCYPVTQEIFDAFVQLGKADLYEADDELYIGAVQELLCFINKVDSAESLREVVSGLFGLTEKHFGARKGEFLLSTKEVFKERGRNALISRRHRYMSQVQSTDWR
ncbi:hypothetical protein [Vibrio crassostreae]|uniref:hypothetical protein n=1 Tax=Vibrio crassostreae TaxID=246167 RepID=UPI001B3125DC|nr:hypothetical protein [Vibrio crassostreae]